MEGLWPRTRRARVLAGSCVVTFFVLNVLVLRGSELALDLLISLSGLLLGLALARLIAYPFRETSGNRRTVALFAGLASVFVIVFGGTALAGIPPFPTAEGGNASTAIYGFALGFGVGFPGGLLPAGPVAPGSGTKAVAVVLGTVVALFSMLCVLYLLLEYVVVPLIRTLAA